MANICAEEKTVIYQFHRQRNCSGDGYYELVTTAGKFLGNVSPEELHEELRILETQGYSLQ